MRSASAATRFPTREEIEQLSRPERCVLLQELTRVERQLLAAQVDLIDVMDADDDHVVDGHRSMRNLLVAQTNTDTATAGFKVRAMKTLRSLPQVRDRLRAGEFGVAQVQSLTAAHSNPRARGDLPLIEDQILAWSTWEHAEFDGCVRDFVRLVDADGAEQRSRQRHQHRHFHHAHAGEGWHGSHGCGTAQGAAIAKVLEHFERREFDADWADAKARVGADRVTTADLARTGQQRRMDAFHAMCLAAAAATPGLRPPAPLVNVMMDTRTLDETIHWATTGHRPAPDLTDIASRRCQTTDGIRLAPSDALAAMLQGHVRRVVMDAGVTIEMGRRHRLFTGNNRDAVMLRATRCVWSGCDVPSSRCEADHGTAWADDGLTNARDGAPLCDRHNRWKTRGYRVTRRPGGTWHTLRPDGTDINGPPPG